MFHLSVESQFSAAHAIRGYDGPCCRLHGHTYRVVAQLEGAELDDLGMLIDYSEVKRALAEALAPFDHAFLNDVPPFDAINPTSEALARHLSHQLSAALLTSADLRRRVRVAEVTVYESDRQGVGYREG